MLFCFFVVRILFCVFFLPSLFLEFCFILILFPFNLNLFSFSLLFGYSSVRLAPKENRPGPSCSLPYLFSFQRPYFFFLGAYTEFRITMHWPFFLPQNSLLLEKTVLSKYVCLFINVGLLSLSLSLSLSISLSLSCLSCLSCCFLSPFALV